MKRAGSGKWDKAVSWILIAAMLLSIAGISPRSSVPFELSIFSPPSPGPLSPCAVPQPIIPAILNSIAAIKIHETAFSHFPLPALFIRHVKTHARHVKTHARHVKTHARHVKTHAGHVKTHGTAYIKRYAALYVGAQLQQAPKQKTLGQRPSCFLRSCFHGMKRLFTKIYCQNIQ